VCPACGDVLLRDGTCFRCSRGDDLARSAARELIEADDEDFDLITRVADQQSLAEHLALELAALLDSEDVEIAEFLVGELDDRGFLEMPLDQAAASLDVDLARVELVLGAIQSVGPLGVGARSVQECLQIQLDRWESIGVTHPLARRLVTEHLDALGLGKYGQLARELNVSYDDIIEARDFVRSHLRPYPIAESTDLAPWERQEGPGFIAPDVVVRIDDEGEIDVEIVESRRFSLSISPLYRELAAHLEAGRQAEGGMSKADKEHVQAQVQRARQFLTHIQERRDTMRRVTAYTMARQERFLRHGPRQLQPLTRAEVAEALDLHESTISRAVSGKYILLPSRQVVPYAMMFKAALSIHDVLREIIEGEGHSLTDAELVDELKSRGYKVARRTVAKYRNEMGILPSSLR
jgi:RNA polymerase sigma-54 factor